MKPDLLTVLLAADDPEPCETPPGFDWAREMAQVKELAPLLEGVAGRPFTVDGNVQDASFFTDLSIVDEDGMPQGILRILNNTGLAVRFSSFGGLFTVWSAGGEEKELDPSMVGRTVQTVVDRG